MINLTFNFDFFILKFWHLFDCHYTSLDSEFVLFDYFVLFVHKT